MDRPLGGDATHSKRQSRSSLPDGIGPSGVKQSSPSMARGAGTTNFAPRDEGRGRYGGASDAPWQRRSSPLAEPAAVLAPDERWSDANDGPAPRLAPSPRHPARPWDLPLPPPVDFTGPPGGPLPDGGPRNTLDRHAQALPGRQRTTQLPSPAQLYESGGPGGYSFSHPTQAQYGGTAYSPSYGHSPYAPPHSHIPSTSVQYDPTSATYHSPHRSGGDDHPGSSSHFRPVSASWDYGYQPMASIKPPTLDTYRKTDAYRATTSPRAINPSLSSIPLRDQYDPFIRPDDRPGPPNYVMSTSPNDFASSSSTYLSPDHAAALPDTGVKMRRTSLESGTRRTSNQPHVTVTSRLGLDPVAKQERRREQNRLAQRAFRARAKQREQDKTPEQGEH